jgi:hypothetical protein
VVGGIHKCVVLIGVSTVVITAVGTVDGTNVNGMITTVGCPGTVRIDVFGTFVGTQLV